MYVYIYIYIYIGIPRGDTIVVCFKCCKFGCTCVLYRCARLLHWCSMLHVCTCVLQYCYISTLLLYMLLLMCNSVNVFSFCAVTCCYVLNRVFVLVCFVVCVFFTRFARRLGSPTPPEESLGGIPQAPDSYPVVYLELQCLNGVIINYPDAEPCRFAWELSGSRISDPNELIFLERRRPAGIILVGMILVRNQTSYPHPRLQVFPRWKRALNNRRKTKNSLTAGTVGWG